MKTQIACFFLLAIGLELAFAFQCPYPNGFYQHPSNSHKFIRCVNGYGYEYDCPADLVWNQSKGQCDFTTGPQTSPTKPVGPSRPEVINQHREAYLHCPVANGFFKHPNPHKFFRCVNGLDYEYICPEDLVWNSAKNQCDYQSNAM